MPKPTFVTELETSWSAQTGQTKTLGSLSLVAGDILVGLAGSENTFSQHAPLTITGGTGVTWTNRQQSTTGGGTAYARGYTGACASTNSATPVVTKPNNTDSVAFGETVFQFRDSDGVGNTNIARSTGAPSVSLTTTQDNSAVCCIVVDYNAANGTSRTWRSSGVGTATERSYFRNAANYTVYAAVWEDVGTAGAKTFGLTAPTGQAFDIIAIEIKGTSGSTQNLAGTADGTSTTTALLSTTKVFAGAADGLSTTAGILGVTYVFAGSATGLSSAVGAVGLSLPLAGSAAGQSTTTADLSRGITFAGSAIGQASADAAFSLSLVFAGSSTGLSSTLGALSVATTFAGSAAGITTTTGVLSTTRNFAGSATGQATADAAVSVALVFAGSATGTSTTIAAFAGDSRLIGTSDGTSTAQAALSVNIALAGAAAGLSTTQADLRPERNFAGSAVGASTASASLALGVEFAGSAIGQSTATASLAVAVIFAASASGSSSAIGDIKLVGEFETTPGPYEVTAIDVFTPGLRRWALFIQSEQTVFLGGQE